MKLDLFRKMYFIEMRATDGRTSKTLFYHKPFFMTKRKMVEDVNSDEDYKGYTIWKIKRIK